MRRLLALTLLISSLACGCAAGLGAPAALAARSGAGLGSAASTSAGGTPSQPSFGLSNAASNSVVSTPQTISTPATSTTSSNGGLSGLDAVIIAIVAMLLLAGIAFWVWHDSRGHVARLGHGHQEPMFGQRAHAGSKAPQKPRKLTPAERRRRRRGRAR